MQALVKKRGVIKGKLTRAANTADDSCNDVTAIDIWLETVSKLEADFEEIQIQIEELATLPVEGEDDLQTAERDSFERAVFEFKLKLKQKRHTLIPAEGAISQSHQVTKNSTTRQHTAPRVKLQKINLPTFSGDWQQWPSFYQLFNKFVHEDPAYRAIEKFFQLSSHLSGEAAKLIESIELTEENYDNALHALKSRYDNQRLIVMKHLKNMFELPAASTDAQLRPLIDAFNNSIRALSAQGLPTDQWDAILLYLLSTRLGPGIRRQWEVTIEDSTRLPVLCDLTAFLEQRATASEVLAATASTLEKRSNVTTTTATKTTPADTKHTNREVRYTHVTTQISCPICKESHFAYQCPTYLNASLADRENFVSNHRLCGNCLNPRHATANCRSSKCKKCGNSHHTSLHKEYSPPLQPSSPDASVFSGLTAQPQTSTFLPTACVHATNSQHKISARMVIDSASQCTLITDTLARQLNLKPMRISVNMEGIGGATATAPQFAAMLTIQSRHSKYALEIFAKILPVITHYRPMLSKTNVELLHQPGVPLADDFKDDAPIDILLGAEYWSTIMQPGKLQITSDHPPLLNSSFGWLVSGNLTCHTPTPPTTESCCFTLEAQLRKFWEIEDASFVSLNSKGREMTIDELECERLFSETTSRDEVGRYTVSLPFNEHICKLGESRSIAERQFLQIERRMQRDPRYRENYHAFMREYENLGHMTPVNSSNDDAGYFLPHHAITRPDDPSKFRVVFNGSQRTSTGISLNYTVHAGPPVQNEILTILLRFRRHAVGLGSDIEKMYRQILVHKEHRQYQKILWRFSSNQPLRTYCLNTVTYGLKCAPYLAIRCLIQLARDEQATYPLAAPVLLNDDYVDDILSGADSIDEATHLVDELMQLAASGQFNLRKWSSNEPHALVKVWDKAESKKYSFDGDQQFSKVLGMLWETDTDVFAFHSNLPAVEGELTKRKLLSYLSRIFDPLGLLAPIIIVAKCLLQKLWLQPVGWDSVLDDKIQRAYENYRSTTNEYLHKIRIPRHVDTSPRITYTLHGFSDASEDAYAGCVYINVVFDSGETISHLLCAKTRVAPINAVSVPRLELCGAVLLTRVMTTIATTYPCAIEQRFAYSDSTIVLSWLSKPSRTWKTFVSNRVSEIASSLPTSQWRHIRSQHNSADIASRGTTVETLANSTLWWNPPLPPPLSVIDSNASQSPGVLKEQRKITTVSLTTSESDSIISHIVNKYSSHAKMLRALALVQRAIQHFKIRDKQSCRKTHQLPLADRIAMVPETTVSQLSASHDSLIQHCQEIAYPVTFQRLRDNRPLKKKDSLRSLTPFIDDSGLLRVRGRLSLNENLGSEITSPILLPGKSHFTITLIRDMHATNLHSGTNQLISMLRQKYWIVNARDTVRRVIRKCVTCRRLNGTPLIQQPTGNLPASRITPSRPFSIVGVDYGGPIMVRFSLARKATSTKAYIALFVCFTTKAVHLELVSDLTTDAFLAALERFISRRGLPAKIYSDNGTNFVGANRKITELSQFLATTTNDILRHLAAKTIEWHFIPPHAPNFGGLWEAGMKSAKRHLIAAVKAQLLTFEEITTVLAQAEACLNSRPLTYLSPDPEATMLTPGHFLTGDSLKASPVTAVVSEQLTLAKRWRLVQQAAQTFWSTWSRMYLTELQQRAKTAQAVIFNVGEIVLLREDNTPALQWPMGKIESLHPGKDGIVRVVSIRTQIGTTKRPVSKLVRLLVDAN